MRRNSAEHEPKFNGYTGCSAPAYLSANAAFSPRAPFSHPDWLFEIKWDGFRSLLYSDSDCVRLVSRNGYVFKSFPGLCEGLARDLKARRCVLDGEIVSLGSNGKPQSRDLLFRRAEPRFIAFDLL